MTGVLKIISGGQTGADRGALDAAITLGLERGGMAPSAWRAEDGTIPEHYRVGMTQSKSWAYPPRTRANIEMSDATLIVSLGPLPMDSGSMLTSHLARRTGKPCLALRVEQLAHPTGQAIVRGWLIAKNIHTLNVAGPRESREPGIQAATRDALVAILSSKVPT